MAALQDETRCGDDGISALLAREPRILLDPIKRTLATSAVDRKNRLLRGEVDCVVSPLAVANFAPVKAQNLLQLAAVKENRPRSPGTPQGDCCEGESRGLAAFLRRPRPEAIFGGFLLFEHQTLLSIPARTPIVAPSASDRQGFFCAADRPGTPSPGADHAAPQGSCNSSGQKQYPEQGKGASGSYSRRSPIPVKTE